MPESHRIRITPAGKVDAYVTAAITFLEANPGGVLVLSTAPEASSSTNIASNTTTTTNNNNTTSNTASTTTDDSSNNTTTPTPSSTLHASTIAAPRAITVAERVKRTLVSRLTARAKSAKSKANSKSKSKQAAGDEAGDGETRDAEAPPVRGVWQYTETGALPIPREVPTLARVLGGKTKPKMTHRPFLQITLALRPLGLEGRNVTLQCVEVGVDAGREGAAKSKARAGTSGRLTAGGKRKSEVDAVGGGKRARIAAV